ncbi:MAG: DNA replication/repair protein RecF [Candidatus Izemoplasmatales bacterium]
MLKKITLTNFRNYSSETIEFGKGIHFIIGSNGEGKTNLLESIYFLALSKSYKSSDQILIKHHEDMARVEGNILSHSRLYDLKMIISNEGKRASINKIEQKRLSDYIGTLKIISFLPEDMNLIKGSPKERRYFFDIYLGQMDKNYITELSNYKYLLKQRNELLKTLATSSHPDYLLLDVITEQLAEAMKPVVERRKEFVQQVNQFLEKEYLHFSSKQEKFEIVYKPSIEGDIDSFLKSKYRSDVFSKATTYGAHRDDYEFRLNNHLAVDYASNGEQRTLILTLDMAMYEMMNQGFKESPLILLDDVFSELDDEKQNKLIAYINKIDAQAIITTTTIQDIHPTYLSNAKIYRVKNGHIKEETKSGEQCKV